ncbi:hypothetical protein RF55_22357 [Lasius niger]|uniref:Uncharacterized protein n=1 Tax=Lasius niger TaxID=67767 RepID=A0A0J7JWR9_LASNI|nr:hypothetical protein RF55_22357 [Lasius niger]
MLEGHPVDSDAVSVYNLLDEASLNNIAENAASRVWNRFVTFGFATAGVFGILVIVRIIKLLVDTAIHGYALHTAYGWSMHLFGAIWSSFTHLLLYLARGSVNKGIKDEDDESSSPSALIEPPALPARLPVTDRFLESTENARSNIESAIIDMTPDVNRYQIFRDRLRELEQIPTITSQFVLK